MKQIVKGRVNYKHVDDHEKVFSNDFLDYLIKINDRFSGRIIEIRARRKSILNNALENGVQPISLPKSSINISDWKVSKIPEDLKTYGIEISGPASITPMFINGLKI